jgi:hypothetical protein
MGLWYRYLLGLDETQELTQNEITKRHTLTVELTKDLAELKAQKDILIFLAGLHYDQKKVTLERAFSGVADFKYEYQTFTF